MDVLSGLLDGPRACNAFLLRSVLRPPWAIRVEDEAPLTLVAIVRGTATLRSDDGRTHELGPGDVAILRGPDPYTVADAPATPPQVIIKPGQQCVTPDGVPQSLMGELGARSWGNDAGGTTVMITGTYTMDGEVSNRVLAVLPTTIVMRRDSWTCPVLPLLDDELDKDDPGQDAVLDRLLDVLLIAVLRAWLNQSDTPAPRWYAAHNDPVAGPALRALYADPAQPWSVASLARAIGLSRAALARHFTAAVGEPPMSFLTSWRLALAADLLTDSELTVAAIAQRVGYSTPFALSAAFKREREISPREYRLRARSAHVRAAAP